MGRRGDSPVAQSGTHAAGGAAGAPCSGDTSGGAYPAAPTSAAPSAMSCLGWVSSATGRPSAPASSSATSGMRDEPPTSTIAATCSGATSAERRTRRMESIVCSRVGRTSSSKSARVRRNVVLVAPMTTGSTVSVSVDSTSLAITQSRRTRSSAATVCGSSMSMPCSCGPSDRRTCWNTASSKSTPPRCSMPSGVPTMVKRPPSLRSTAASKVPPPRS